MSQSNDRPQSYRPDIDGLRAVAVLAVVLFHARLSCPGGFVGVDIFFVISGYLITGLIVRDLDRSHFRLSEFWERRVRRIVPALTVAIALTVIAGWYCYLPDDFFNLGRAVIAQGLVLSNVFHYRSISYFTPATENFPLLHTWSLAVEEQFYIALPIVLMVIHRWARRWVPLLIGIGCLASFACGVWATSRHPDASFYLLPSRAWELLLGSWLAVYPQIGSGISGRVKATVAWGGLVAMLGSIGLMHEAIPFPSYATLIPTLGAVALIWGNRDQSTSSGWLLSRPVLVFIGRISYSLYLLHWPIIAMADYWFRDEIDAFTRFLLMVIAGILAVASWKYVETPVRAGGFFARPRLLFTVAGLATLFLIATGGLITRGTVPQRFTTADLKWMPSSREQTEQSRELRPDAALRGELMEFGDANGTRSCLIWGDSHAMAFLPALDDYCREHRRKVYAGMYSNTPPVLDFVASTRFGLKSRSPLFNAAVVESALLRQVDTAFLVASWDKYAEHPAFETALRDTVEFLEQKGVQVVLVRDVPHHSGHVPRMLMRAAWLGRDPQGIGVTAEEHRSRNRVADAALQRMALAGAQVVDPTSYLVDSKGRCRVELSGVPLYRDAGHLTRSGAELLIPVIATALDPMVQRPKSTEQSAIRMAGHTQDDLR